MRLMSLSLCNFRQFYGKSPRIEFAHGETNVTVVHGSNGSGKTNLLNAFTWVLFDSLTPGFQLPEQIVNKRALREAKEGDTVEAWVELEFEHDERRYAVKRTAQAVKTSGDPGFAARAPQPPTLQWCGPDGIWKVEERVFDIVGRILPTDLHSYFFFDGERIERIVQPRTKEKEEIANATKKLLGIEGFIRAELHLGAVRRDLEKELKEVGDEETKVLLEQKQNTESDLDRMGSRQHEIQANVEAHRIRITEIEERLRKLKDVEAIQKRRDQLEKDLTTRRDSLVQGRHDLTSEISSSGYKLFLSGDIEKFTSLIDSLRQRGELPAGIKKQFVNDLLNHKLCICRRAIEEGSAARQAVEEWMMKAGLADVEEKAIRMGGELSTLSHSISQVLERIDNIQRKRELDRREISRIEDELDDIKRKLIGSPLEEISELESQRTKALDTINQLILEQGENSRHIKDLHKKIDEIDGRLGKLKAHEERQRIAQRRAEAAGEAIRVIAEIRGLLEDEFRKSLQRKVSNLFRTISPTPYVPDLGRDYSLRLLEAAGGTPLPVAASQGESQILSLAFIGSIIELAKEQHAKREGLPGPETSSYPVVMDSPFGSLDPIYRHHIAEHLPALANQIVVLVTKTQWRGEVELSMQRRIGRAYVLTYYSPRNDIEEDSVEIAGRSWELIKRSPNDFEYTEIREVPHGG